MAFRYQDAPWSQHLLVGVMVLVGFGVGATDGFAAVWAALVSRVGERWLLAGGLLLLHTLVFWPLCLLFHRVDQTDRPQFIAKHRIQQEKRKHPDLATTLKVLVLNQFLILPPLLLVFGEILIRVRGWSVEATLPSAPRFALELLGLGVMSQAVFYIGHRFLHRKWWMKRVHRVHHEFRASTAWASEYAHPFEFVVGNFLALTLGPLILAPHLASMYLFTVLAVITIIVHHSGYALPWAPWSVPHDWHHYRTKELFGSTGLLDRLLGTAPEFRTLKDGDVR